MNIPEERINDVVLVTGSSSGIGEAIVYQFARSGSCVVVTYHRDKATGERVRDKCIELGAAEVLLIHLDVTNEESISHAIGNIVHRFGHIDILINNAGVLESGALVELSREDILKQVQVNLLGAMFVTQKALPHIKKSIINIGSMLSLEGKRNFSVYVATKFGLRGFTQSIAQEYSNLRIFSIHPGRTATRMVGGKGVPPKDVARVVFDVASDNIRACSGEDIVLRDCMFGVRWRKYVAFLRSVKHKLF